MHVPTTRASAFTRSLWLTVVCFIVLSIAFAAYVRTEKQIDAAHERRTQTLLLATELEESTEQLTHMARAYITTQRPYYKQKYRELIDIREGVRPRPESIQQRYGENPSDDEDGAERPSISILALALRLGLTEQEFEKFKQAKDQSDRLTATEYAAMDLVDSASGPADDKHRKAREMLFDQAYIEVKDAILRPLSDFYRMVDQRTRSEVQEQMRVATAARFAFICFGVLLLTALALAYRALRETLGGPLDELHARIARIGRGDFSMNGLPDLHGRRNSVLGWLLETQKNLAQLDTKNRDADIKEQRLISLYKALGQCNGAIARCANEAELFAAICRNVVSAGEMDMAWVGMLDRTSKRILPVFSHGAGEDYVNGIAISIDENEAIGRGPTAVSFCEDRAVWCQDFLGEPVTAPWRKEAEKFGWRASAALPLHRGGAVVGVLCMYSKAVQAFDEPVRELVARLAGDIDFALNRFESERQRDQALEALASSRRMLRTIIDSTPLRIFWKDTNLRYIGCNRAFAEDTTLNSPQEIIGKDDYQLVWHEYAERYRAIDRQVMESGVPRLFYEEDICTAFGKRGWVRASKVPLFDETGKTIGLLGMYEDITEQKRVAEHIQYLANYDTLTGLPSRASVNERLEYALHMVRRGDRSLTLMFLDLDNFKDINDALGHSVGDAVLIELAGRLRGAVRAEDTVARFGGDEFVLLLPDTDERGATFLAQKLLDAIAEPCRVDRYSLSLAASIGIAIAPRDGTDIDTLFRSADTAMFQAKREGRRAYRFSTPAMQERSARNLQLVSAMNEALAHDQFQVYFQPQISMQDGRIVGVEALIRWQHPEFGALSPSEFMPVAEDSGLILPIGEMVLRNAVREASQWNGGIGPLTVSVNLSFGQFRNPDLPGLVSRILAEEGLPADRLDLELTESVAMNNPEAAVATIQQLHELGVSISIDDFGTGYSSLSYLKKFKLHKIKIDQSFVRDITTDPEDKAIVGAIIQMAKRLGLRTTAEGVETAEQMDYLRVQGCDEVQGFYCSKPLPADQFQQFAKNQNSHPVPPQEGDSSYPANAK